MKYVSLRVLICCSLTPSCEGDISSISSGWLLERPSLGPPGVEGAAPIPWAIQKGLALNLGDLQHGRDEAASAGTCSRASVTPIYDAFAFREDLPCRVLGDLGFGDRRALLWILVTQKRIIYSRDRERGTGAPVCWRAGAA